MERTTWTSGLVRWRLKLAGDTMRLLPGGGGGGMRSCMPEIVREQWKDAPTPVRGARPVARSEDITLMDKAYAAVLAVTEGDPADRIVMLGVMLDMDSTQLIEHARERSLKVKLPSDRTIRRRAQHLCELIAEGWNAAGYPVDGPTLQRQAVEEAKRLRYARPSAERNRHGVLAVMQAVAGADWDGKREPVQK